MVLSRKQYDELIARLENAETGAPLDAYLTLKRTWSVDGVRLSGAPEVLQMMADLLK